MMAVRIEMDKLSMKGVRKTMKKELFDGKLVIGEHPAKLQMIKDRLVDVSDGEIDLSDTSWCEGFISCLADVGIISEDEFEHLMEWLGKNGSDEWTTDIVDIMTASMIKNKH